MKAIVVKFYMALNKQTSRKVIAPRRTKTSGCGRLEFSEWNGAYFTKKATMIGPKMVEVIKAILQSRELEVQAYRLCSGVLGFTKKYSKQALEECCGRVLDSEGPT